MEYEKKESPKFISKQNGSPSESFHQQSNLSENAANNSSSQPGTKNESQGPKTTINNDSPEITNWMDPSVCSKYYAWDKNFDLKFGFIPMIRDLIQTHGTNITVLDYGCGTGEISLRLIEEKITKVEAVDTSESMIDIAMKHSSLESINYRKIFSGELPYSKASFDATICCFVFINVPTRDQLLKITLEIYRTLKPNGTFYILDLNPDPDTNSDTVYCDGEGRTRNLEVSGHGVLKLMSVFWAKSTFEDILHRAGFINIQIHECNGSHLSEEERRPLLRSNGSLYTPFLLFKATKPLHS